MSKKSKLGRPESQDPKILFPSFRLEQSQVKAMQAKAKEGKKSLGQYTAEILKAHIRPNKD